MTQERMDTILTKLAVKDHSKYMSLKVVPLDQLWIEAPDAKALSALYLYHVLKLDGKIPPNY